MNIGIVGHEAAKFTTEGKQKAIEIISEILYKHFDNVLVSGGCHGE